MNDESKAHGQLDEIMRLKDENYHLQHCNQELQRTINVDLKNERVEAIRVKESLEEKVKVTQRRLAQRDNEI